MGKIREFLQPHRFKVHPFIIPIVSLLLLTALLFIWGFTILERLVREFWYIVLPLPLIIIGVIGWILYERRKGQKELLQKQKEWEEEDLRRSEDENRDPDRSIELATI